jgi:excisionase family DNA binding protein
MEPTAVTSTRLLTVPEAADRLRLSARMVERLIERGEMVPLRIGRSVRLTDTEIEEFIERKRHNHDERAANSLVGKAGNHDAHPTG